MQSRHLNKVGKEFQRQFKDLQPPNSYLNLDKTKSKNFYYFTQILNILPSSLYQKMNLSLTLQQNSVFVSLFHLSSLCISNSICLCIQNISSTHPHLSSQILIKARPHSFFNLVTAILFFPTSVHLLSLIYRVFPMQQQEQYLQNLDKVIPLFETLKWLSITLTIKPKLFTLIYNSSGFTYHSLTHLSFDCACPILLSLSTGTGLRPSYL